MSIHHISGRRSAIVTGASRGIGAAIVRPLARHGYAVTVNYSGDAAPANDIGAAIVGQGGDDIAAAAPLGRPGEPIDIANVVAFLAGSQGGWINRQVVHVDGGVI